MESFDQNPNPHATDSPTSGECSSSSHTSIHAQERHHHHTHAAHSQHAGGHHLLTVEHVSLSFERYASTTTAQRSTVEVLHDITLSVHAGELVAVVGASGSGKTLLADTLLGQFNPQATVRGHIWFDGVEQDAASLARLRGKDIAFVPQSVAALDPLMRVGKFVEDVPRERGHARSEEKKARRARREALFARYGLSDDVARRYPHELSGGMARRVLLCSALMEHPRLIIADEPTPGLDETLARQALADLKACAHGANGVLLITHDIELALTVADRIAVFHEGTIVEETSAENFAAAELLEHPFTRALWHALPTHEFTVREGSAGGESVGEKELLC